MSLKIIVDSNFLFIPVKFCVDIFSEMERVTNRKVELILLSSVYDEVRMLSTGRGVRRRDAMMALQYAEKLKLVSCEARPGETVDDIIVRVAAECRCPVATNDQALRKRLKDINISVIYLRGKSHLELDRNMMEV